MIGCADRICSRDHHAESAPQYSDPQLTRVLIIIPSSATLSVFVQSRNSPCAGNKHRGPWEAHVLVPQSACAIGEASLRAHDDRAS